MSRWLKRVLLVGLLAVSMLAAVVLTRAALAGGEAQGSTSGGPPGPTALPAGADVRFARALAIPTISHGEAEDREPSELLAFHDLLTELYPLVHATLERETINDYSLLYTWRGSEPGLAPVLLLGHFDVVPVEPGTEEDWLHPPFGGEIGDGYIWGRGALDDKLGVIGVLEACESLLAGGFAPRRTVLLGFGHDEEIGGREGARQVAAALEQRGIEPELVLDEGGVVIPSGVPGTDRPVALIGIAEKGFVTVELTLDVEGGHSSMPPAESTIGRLARAVDRLEQNQMPARLEGPALAMFTTLLPEMSFGYRVLAANLWLFEDLLVAGMKGDPTAAAMVRTTTAPTIFEAGIKENVLPGKGRAVVNFRIAPWDSVDGVLAHVRETIADPEIEVSMLGEFRSEPSTVSPTDSAAYELVADTIREIFPEAVVAPYLVVGGTDARYFTSVSPNVYRFLPYALESDDLPRVHGTNERASVTGLGRTVAYYVRLLQSSAGH